MRVQWNESSDILYIVYTAMKNFVHLIFVRNRAYEISDYENFPNYCTFVCMYMQMYIKKIMHVCRCASPVYCDISWTYFVPSSASESEVADDSDDADSSSLLLSENTSEALSGSLFTCCCCFSVSAFLILSTSTHTHYCLFSELCVHVHYFTRTRDMQLQWS